MNEQVVVNIRKQNTIEMASMDAQQNQEKKDPEKSNYSSNTVKTILAQTGTKIINKGVSLYGDLSGNYIEQTAISQLTSVAGDIATIAIGGPIGIAAVAAKIGFQTADSFIQQSKTNYKIRFAAERTGNSAINGGRWQR